MPPPSRCDDVGEAVGQRSVRLAPFHDAVFLQRQALVPSGGNGNRVGRRSGHAGLIENVSDPGYHAAVGFQGESLCVARLILHGVARKKQWLNEKRFLKLVGLVFRTSQTATRTVCAEEEEPGVGEISDLR